MNVGGNVLRLIQVIHRMFYLEYTEDEIKEAFTAVQDGDITFDDLLDTLNIDNGSVTANLLAIEKINKWPSALTVVKMKLNEEL